jgi:hypothetical protein
MFVRRYSPHKFSPLCSIKALKDLQVVKTLKKWQYKDEQNQIFVFQRHCNAAIC